MSGSTVAFPTGAGDVLAGKVSNEPKSCAHGGGEFRSRSGNWIARPNHMPEQADWKRTMDMALSMPAECMQG